MKKYLVIFLLELQRLLAYRARVLVWLLLDVSTVAILPFFWLALYGGKDALNGFSRADIVTYYIIIGFIGLLDTSHVSRHTHESILQGTLSTPLVQPYSFILNKFTKENSYKVFSGGFAFLLAPLLLLFLPAYFFLPSSPRTIVWFCFFLLLSRLLSFFLEMMIGLGSFWLQETGALMQIRFLIEKTFAGQFAPLALFPPALRLVSSYLPFQYLYYIPAQVYLEKIPPTLLYHHAFVALMWVSAAFLSVLFLWKRGLYRYDGAGI